MNLLSCIISGWWIVCSILYIIYCVKPQETIDIFQNFNILLTKIFGNKYGSFLKIIINYIFFQNNRIVQIFYYSLILFGNIAYYISIFKNIDSINAFLVFLEIIITIIGINFYFLTWNTEPGYLEKENKDYYYKKYKEYFDNGLNIKNNICKTCEIEKPPFTKHCNLCKKCIVNHDHHCIWVKGCVGEKNYKYFLLFLLSHSIFCGIKSIFLSYILKSFIINNNLFHIQYKDLATGMVYDASYGIILKYLWGQEYLSFFVLILCAVMSVCLILFFLYHWYLINKNVSASYNNRRSYYKVLNKKKLVILSEEIEHLENEYKENKTSEIKKLLENKEKEWLKIGKAIESLAIEFNKGFIKHLFEIFNR